jgi:hypothetical protein
MDNATPKSFYLSGLFAHMQMGRRLKVFLCGSQPEPRGRDLRRQLRHELNRKMGCDAFLGEEIEGLDDVRVKKKGDLIVIFLGSAGTIAEVTAFALNNKLHDKLVVFNPIKFRDSDSFINHGPLRLLDQDSIIYYDPAQSVSRGRVLSDIDLRIARQWYLKSERAARLLQPLTFEEYVTLCGIYVSHPISYAELCEVIGSEKIVRPSLTKLFQIGMIKEEKKTYLPQMPIDALGVSPSAALDISRVRLAVLNARLQGADRS